MAGASAGRASAGKRAIGSLVLSWAGRANNGRPGRSFFCRIVRALRLDPALYREVASSRASSRQATLVVLLAAGGAGLGGSVRALLDNFGLRDLEQWTGYVWFLFVNEALPIAILGAVAQLVVWPVWAAGLWIIGGRLASPEGRDAGFWPVARALAYAQAPAIFLLLSPIFVRLAVPVVWFAAASGSEPGSAVILDMSVLRTLEFGGRTLVSAWVLVGTFLAMRETLGISYARTLGALLLAGVAISVLLGVVATAAFLAVPSPPFEFGPEYYRGDFLGIGGEAPSVILSIQSPLPITSGLDFNLGLIDAFTVFVKNPFSFRFFP